MSTLGLIADTPQVADAYQRAIVSNAALTSAPLVETVDGQCVHGLAQALDAQGLADHLLPAIDRLQGRGANLVALTSVTAHLAHHLLRQRTELPVIDVSDAVLKATISRRDRAVFLLGSNPTMRQRFLKTPIVLSHIAVITPSSAEKDWLGDVIRYELKGGDVTPETIRAFEDMVEKGRDEGAQSVVLASSDLCLLAQGRKLALPIVSSVDAHARVIAAALVDNG